MPSSGPDSMHVHLAAGPCRRDEQRIARDYLRMARVDPDDPGAGRRGRTSSPRCAASRRRAPAVAVPAADARGLPRVPRAASTSASSATSPAARDDGAIVGWLNVSEIVRGALPERVPRLRRRRRPRRPGLHDRGAPARAARGVRHRSACTGWRPTSSPATRPRSRSPARCGFELRGLLPALPEGRRALARSRALGTACETWRRAR